MVLRIVAHKVEWADYARPEEISTLTPTFDILMLNGTGRAALHDEDVLQTGLPDHTCVQFGFRNLRWSNRSCGLALLFN
eukprot:2847270-Pyramimonas_sp.AAC.1